MEGMIPVEEFKINDEIKSLKVGKTIDVFFKKSESFKGEIVVSREKARRLTRGKKWKKFLIPGRINWLYNW